MATTRREFIHNGLAFVSLGLAMPHFLMQAAAADPAGAQAPGVPTIPAGKILVVIEMSGGNDGLNTVIPFADPNYAKLRPNIGIKASDVVKIDGNLGMHPKLKPFGAMYEQGHLAIVNSVGYPNPNRSHFQSMDIWQMGNPEIDIKDRVGWLARYFDDDGHLKSNPLSGVTLGSSLPLTLFSESAPVSAVGNGRDYGFRVDAGDRDKQLATLKALYAQGTVAGGNAEFVRNVGSDAYSSSLQLQQAMDHYDTKAGDAAKYPRNNGFADGLQTIARLIAGGLGTRVYYHSLGGFDTHANQPYQHGQLLGQLADGLKAFFDDLTLQGRANDVIVMTFSEFGRRVKENGSAGTDHGAGSVMFLAGASVKGGLYGEAPNLGDLDDGDVRFHTDFRSVYATLLDNWLGCKSSGVLSGTFPHLGFV
jgi:uncharacterized protein (DUF1501 family)